MNTNTVLTRKATLTMGALMAVLVPRLAEDAKVDLVPALDGVTADNFTERKDSIVAGVKAATEGKLAQDAKLDDLPELLDALGAFHLNEPAPVAMDSAVEAARTESAKAAREAGLKEGIEQGRKEAAETAKGIRIAQDAVEPLVGKIAMDSIATGDDVYRAALGILKVDVKDVHPSAFPALLKAHQKPAPKALAQDSEVEDYSKRFPQTARLAR